MTVRQYSIPGLGGDFTDAATQTAQAPAPAVNANSDINSVADTTASISTGKPNSKYRHILIR